MKFLDLGFEGRSSRLGSYSAKIAYEISGFVALWTSHGSYSFATDSDLALRGSESHSEGLYPFLGTTTLTLRSTGFLLVRGGVETPSYDEAGAFLPNVFTSR